MVTLARHNLVLVVTPSDINSDASDDQRHMNGASAVVVDNHLTVSHPIWPTGANWSCAGGMWAPGEEAAKSDAVNLTVSISGVVLTVGSEQKRV